MWKLADKPKSVMLTRDLATEFAEMRTIPADRPLNERRVKEYRKQLVAGSFRPPSWAMCFCKETGLAYRVNGKHTSTLFSRLDETPELHVLIERYEADTLEDVVKLYSTFDSRIQVRTAADINRSFASVVPEFAGISTRTVTLAVTGVSYARWQDGYASIPAAERAELLLGNIDYVLWLDSILRGGKTLDDSRHLHRGPVAAAMHTTFAKSRKDSAIFWEAVRDETGERPDLPDRKIAKFLLQHKVNIGNGVGSARKTSQKEFYVKCIHAWNAWRKGTTTDLKYYPIAKVPAAA